MTDDVTERPQTVAFRPERECITFEMQTACAERPMDIEWTARIGPAISIISPSLLRKMYEGRQLARKIRQMRRRWRRVLGPPRRRWRQALKASK